MSIHLVVNPNAGKKRGLAAAARACESLEHAGIDVETHISTYPGEAVGLAEAAALALATRLTTPTDGGDSPTGVAAPVSGGASTTGIAGPYGVVAVGGDGTLFEVVNGVANAQRRGGVEHPELPVPVGQIPVGTGNSFIKDLAIGSPEEATDVIIAGKTRPVDLGTFVCADGTFHFINLLGAGFVSNVAHRARRYKRWGALSYIIAVIQETIVLGPQWVSVNVDGTVFRRDGVFVEICNSRYTGGNMMMAPNAQLDDGLLDIVLMNSVTRRKLLSLFPSIFSGRHIEDPVIEVFRGRAITLETERPWLLTPDGETFGATPITVGVRPRCLRVFAP